MQVALQKYGNPIAKVSISINDIKNHEYCGEFQTMYMEEPTAFNGVLYLINKMDIYILMKWIFHKHIPGYVLLTKKP